jgi:hypothetical protein
MSLWGEVDNTSFFVYDYKDSSLGKLVDLRDKLKFSNTYVSVTIVKDGDVIYGDRLPYELQKATFNQALNYVWNNAENIQEFDIRPNLKHADGGFIEVEQTTDRKWHDSYADGGSISFLTPETIEFEYKGHKHKFTFTPEQEDWWTAFESHGLEFDVHYDEYYGDISVYEVVDNKADVTNTVYNRKINKAEKIKQHVASMSDEEVLQEFNTINYYELQDNDEYPFEDAEKAREELIKHYSEHLENIEHETFGKGGEIKKTYFYAIRSKQFKEWDEHPQESFTGTWKQMIDLAKFLATKNKSEVRVSNSQGYNNQGYYIHWQSI